MNPNKSAHLYEGDTVKAGWYVLQVKSFKDPRRNGEELFPATHVDGIRYEPGQILQCCPDDAPYLMDADQVNVLAKPRKKPYVYGAKVDDDDSDESNGGSGEGSNTGGE